MPHNIVLAGFMGTGKSTVGKLVARRLNWKFVDADDEIVSRAGMPIPQIFERDGEVRFREIEREICRDLARQPETVIATGGGMLVDDGNRAVMLENSLVVCLNATVDAVESRLRGDDNRPLLKTDWRMLYERRRAAYDQIPVQVETTHKAPWDVASEIIRIWRNHNASA